ncbi:uncharacterized protein LOC127474906 [Manacus candei]|uniref:uncharacterized protein LOC127474906 n=1 Tax=Manacus candei TaxID=415023 RepID=UPI002227B229|nr:uncharacterized protein LOC127474906 [Manacus candei]
MWQSIFSEPEIGDKILWPFAVMLWVDWWPCSLSASSSESSSTSDLAPLPSGTSVKFEWEDKDKDFEYLQNDNFDIDEELPTLPASQVLEGLIVLCETPELARKLEFLVPHMMELLWVGREDLKTKVIMILKRLINQNLEKKKASPMDEYLVENLPRFFDMESSDMREAFICLFRDYLGSAVLRNNKQLKTSLRSALVPLLIRTSDQSPSVAKVHIGRLSTGTERGGLACPVGPRQQDKGCWQWAAVAQRKPWERSLQNQRQQGRRSWHGHFQQLPWGSSRARQQPVTTKA